MSDQPPGNQEPQAGSSDSTVLHCKTPKQSMEDPCSTNDQIDNMSTDKYSGLDVEDQPTLAGPDHGISEGDMLRHKATGATKRSESPDLDTIVPVLPEEEGRHMTSVEELHDDDEVQIVESGSNTEKSSSNPRSSDRPDRIVVDLTMDDDDDDGGYNYSYESLPKQAPEKAIKLEPTDDDACQIIKEDIRTHSANTNTFHDLPAFEPTTFLDEVETATANEHSGQNGDISAKEMGELLKRYLANNVDAVATADELVSGDLSDEDDASKRDEFAKLKEEYEKLKRDGQLSNLDIIKFARANREEKVRLEVRNNRKQREYDEEARNEESLFIPEQPVSPPPQTNDDAFDSTLPHGYAPASTTRSPAPRDSTEPSLSAKKPARGRPKGVKNKIPHQKTARNSRVTKQPGSGAKRGRKQKQPAMFNTNALLHHDIIAEATANQGKAPQPGFTSKVKKDALAQLISSIPIEERNLYAGDKANLSKATMSFSGRGHMKSDGNGNWKLKGMKSSLRNYQLMGVSWMRSRENQKKHPRGGILGDDMGLGKTVSALANMVDGKPGPNHTGSIATLIVVPASLMGQWMAEINKHVEEVRGVLEYRSKMKALDPVALLGSQQVVITSYHEVARSFPNNNPPPEIYTAQAKAEWWEKQIAEHKGPLHQVFWHRIILDEAQAIKNHLSKTSEAVCRLRGCFRWCLSGTPVQNGLEEFYPYFRFLKYPNTGSFELFKRNFVKRNSDKAILRLQACLGEIMLRRTHLDKLFGRPILILPPIKPVQTIEVKFNAVERAVYNIVKHRFVMKIKALSKKDNPNGNYQYIFVLLLRLRQLIAHPLLIQKTLKEVLETEDLERLWSLTRDGTSSLSVGDGAPDGNGETAHALQLALTTAQKSGSSLRFPGSGKLQIVDNQLSNDFRRYLDVLRKDGNWAKANERSLCSACGSPPSQPYITSCLHLYCLSCLNDLHLSEYMQKKEEADCLYCNAKIKKNEAFAAKAFNEAANNFDASDTRQTPEEDIDWYSVGGPILRSAKVKGTVTQIKKWFDQDPTNKIIVFTQFRGMIRVMERVCREEKWGCALYHGAMSFEYRDEQLRDFSDNPEKRILLAAMKAGGVGLNLTAANRVIIIDLWWNSSVEAQAFTRCFRIGQKRDVEVARFVVPDSIDMEILRMQARKKSEIETAVEESHRVQLTVEELVELFGDPSDDDDQHGIFQDSNTANGDDDPFVFPNDPYDDQTDDYDTAMMKA